VYRDMCSKPGVVSLSPRLLCVLVLFLGPSAALAKSVYVSKSSPGPTHNGTTWATAYVSVQQGITGAVAGDEVWVAAENYHERITLKAGVAMYGGFSGTETSRA